MNSTQILYILGLVTLFFHEVISKEDKFSLPNLDSHDNPSHFHVDLENSDTFQELLSWHDTVARGWITRKNTLHIRMLHAALEDEPVLLKYFLDPRNNKPIKVPRNFRNALKEIEDSSEWVEQEYQSYSKNPPALPPYCSSCNCEDDIGKTKSDEDFNNCEWVKDHPYFTKYVICDSEEIAAMPCVPQNTSLDLFELSDTQVVKVPPAAFKNTTVKTIRINSNEVKEVCPTAFSQSRNTALIQMMHNKLRWIWFDGAFEGLNDLVTLQLDYNDITLFEFERRRRCREKKVKNIGVILPNLRVLSLRQNPLWDIPATFFAPFRKSKVRLLVLENCALHKIHPDALSYFPDLRELELSENPDVMEQIEEVFKLMKGNGTRLEVLSLANNALTTVPVSALWQLRQTLVSLDLQKNVFVALGPGAFPPLKKLTSLNLAASNLVTLHEGVFDGMTKLEVLMLNENNLVHISSIGALPSLLTLDISDNVVDDDFGLTRLHIPPNVFENSTKLKTLILSNSELEELDESSFNGLVRLNMLYLDGCKLSSIADFTFRSTPALKILDLSNNEHLCTPNSTMFYGLGALETLKLSSTRFVINKDHHSDPSPKSDKAYDEVGTNNLDFVTIGNLFEIEEPIQNYPNQPFKYLNRLTSLYLDNNRVTFLHAGLFSDLPLLKKLVLSNNELETWENPAFESNPHLENVDLRKNSLHTVTKGMLADFKRKPLFPALVPKSLYLSDNPFHCDQGVCRMKSARDEMQFTLADCDEQGVLGIACRFLTGDQAKVDVAELTSDFCRRFDREMKNDTLGGHISPPPPTTPVPVPEEKQPPGKSPEMDKPAADNPEPTQTQSPSQSESTHDSNVEMNVIISVGCVGAVILLVGIVYVKRTQFQLFWFGLKLTALKRKKSPEDNSSYDYDVFVSYSQLDSNFVQDLVPKLEGNGKLFGHHSTVEMDTDTVSISSSTRSLAVSTMSEAMRVCLHLRDFQVGAPIAENIVECVDRSRTVLIVISKNYMESQWCLFEMNLAYHRLIEGRRSSIILILLESIPNTNRTKVLSHLMKSRTYLQWPGSGSNKLEKELFWTRLTTAIRTEESTC